jgi:hypothetical protein
MAEPLTAEREEAFRAGVENARRGLFMGVADVQRAPEQGGGAATRRAEPRARPFRLGREALAGPLGVGDGIVVGDVHHGVLLATTDVAARALGMAPARSRNVVPPTIVVVEGNGLRFSSGASGNSSRVGLFSATVT